MKSLETLSNVDAEECAGLLLETVTLLMRTIRQEMRRQRPAELSMPQFRTLRILQRHPGVSLSQLAARLDLTLASASKLIDVLEKHGLVSRETSAADRRMIVLTLTDRGWSVLQAAEQATHARLAEMVLAMNETDRAAVLQAMIALHAQVNGQDDERADAQGGD